MSRLRDMARSGLDELLGRVSSGSEELSHVDSHELAAELEARRAAGERSPRKNPRAETAGAGDAARAARRKAADEREARIRGERDRREAAERKAQDAEFRRAQAAASRDAEAQYQAFRDQVKSGRMPSSGAGAGARSAPIGHDPKLAKHYQTLHLPYGAEWSEVKSAYRKLMRKYHPDMHNQSPAKQKAATELSVQVTQAYNELEKHLKK